MSWQMLQPEYTLAGITILVSACVMFWGAIARRNAESRLATVNLRRRMIAQANSASRRVGSICALLSLGLITLALMDIRWGETTEEIPQKGLEVIFALDVSRSMLAEDVTPNRLERAKQQIGDLLDSMAGDRVGLVVFAGEARQVVPLTNHYDDFRQELEQVGPSLLRRGGSQLGTAIRVAAESFLDKTNEHKTVLIITDGEDQESDPIGEAKRIHEEYGVRCVAIGLGDSDSGALVPVTPNSGSLASEGYVRYQGELVHSKLHGEILQQVADVTGGVYIPAGTKRVDMNDVYQHILADTPQKEFESATVRRYIPRYQWFAVPALMLLLLEVWLSTKNVKRRNDLAPLATPFAQRLSMCFIAICLATSNSMAMAEKGSQMTVEQQFANASQAMADGQFSTAKSQFLSINVQGQAKEIVDYDAAVAAYREGDFATAMELFTQSAGSEDDKIAGWSSYNLGNCHFAQATQSPSTDRSTVVARLQEAVTHYRRSLRAIPTLQDARVNIELAMRLLEELTKPEEQSSSEPQEQPPSENDPSSQANKPESDKQENDKQVNDTSQSGQPQGEQPKTDKGTQPDTESNQPSAPKEGSTSSDSGEGKSDSDSQKSQESSTESMSQQQQQTSQSSNAQNSTSKDRSGTDIATDTAEAPESDANAPAQETSGDLSALNEMNTSNEDNAQHVDAGENPNHALTREEAMKLLQSVRDRDWVRRLEQHRRQRSRNVPVVKDW